MSGLTREYVIEQINSLQRERIVGKAGLHNALYSVDCGKLEAYQAMLRVMDGLPPRCKKCNKEKHDHYIVEIHSGLMIESLEICKMDVYTPGDD